MKCNSKMKDIIYNFFALVLMFLALWVTLGIYGIAIGSHDDLTLSFAYVVRALICAIA